MKQSLAMLLALVFVAAPEQPDPLAICQVPAHIERVIDGDTVVASIDLPWDITLRHQSVRASDFDAWETTKRRRSVEVTDAEVERGKAAAEALRMLIAESKAVYMVPDGRDNYGRLLAKWIVVRDGEVLRVAKWARANKHVRAVE